MDFLIDVAMATGPVLGYLHQYRLIQIQKSVGTFSIDICGILLFANILRLNFYIFNHYQLSLFFQSINMIAAQIFLVRICTKYAHKKADITLSSPHSTTASSYEEKQKPQSFWRWNQFSSYLFFIAAFTFLTFSISLIFKQLQFQAYGVFIGLAALLSQSVLIFPQILKNCLNKQTKGLSHILVGLNLFGDIFKLVYFLLKSQPFQFVLCGIIQCCLDSFVILQIFYYKRLQEQKFQKQNKSLIIEKKSKSTHQQKGQTQQNLENIEMKNIEQINSPMDEEDPQFQPSYIQNNQDQQEMNFIETGESLEKQNMKDFVQIKQPKDIQNQLINLSDSSEDKQRQYFKSSPNGKMRKSTSEKPSISENQFIQTNPPNSSRSTEQIPV